MDGVTSVVKRTISVPADVFAAVEAEVSEEDSVSELFSEGARLLLRRRAGERAIAAYEAEHGPISQEALEEADRALDEAGL
jgi:predicted CopG family antitoxin